MFASRKFTLFFAICLLCCAGFVISIILVQRWPFYFRYHNRSNNLMVMFFDGDDHNEMIMRQLFEKRREIANEACRRRNCHTSETIRKPFYEFTFYNDEFKIPKVASTNIKKMLQYLLPLNNQTADLLLPHRLIELRNLTERKRRLLEYKKIIFVRHPLDRLISAWRHKYSSRWPDKDDEPKLAYNALKILGSIRYQQHSNHPVSNVEPTITLDEFLQHVVNEANVSKYMPTAVDEHWRPYVDHCEPCRVNYDFIGKLENLSEELAYVMSQVVNNGDDDEKENRRLNVFLRLLLPKPANNSFAVATKFIVKNRPTLRSFYANQTSPQRLQQIIDSWYASDYDIFGYDRDE